MADGAEADISITFTQNLLKLSMIRQSIKRRIVSIAVGLIILMLATSVLSMVMVGRVGNLLDELTEQYIPANSSLTRINILTLERALALRRMVIAKMQEPPDESTFKARMELYEAKDAEIDREVQSLRKSINAIINDKSTPSDNTALARIDGRIDSLLTDARRYLKELGKELLAQLDARDFEAARRSLARADTLRDELEQRSRRFGPRWGRSVMGLSRPSGRSKPRSS